MSYTATVLADSISHAGYRVTTLEVTFPRFILAEFNTHRVLSRSSASSRAIKVADRIAQVQKNPFVPEAFGRNQRGMQAESELDGANAEAAREAWLSGASDAVATASALDRIEVHKQHANRVLEPFAWHTVVVTSTEWANWDALRVSPMAQPEMHKTAHMMREVRESSSPLRMGDGNWHLPYLPFAEDKRIRAHGVDPIKVSIGRCAAVSYERQSSKTDMEKDAARCDKLVKDGHMSPLEHALRPMTAHELAMFARHDYVWENGKWRKSGRVRFFLGNVEGWVQYRKLIPGEDVYRGQ